MSNPITLSAPMRANLLSLQGTSKLMAQTQDRLSTGKKVNSALDNSNSYFTASSLNNRAADLNSLLDDMGQAIQTIKAADAGIKSINKLAEQAKSLVNTAASDKASTVASKGAINLDGIDTGSNQTPAAAGKYDITVGDTTVTVDFSTAPADEDAALTAIETAINGASIDGIKAEVVDGRLTVTASDGKTVKIEGDVAGLKINGTADNAGVASAQKNYNEILSQIDDLAADAGYKGTNLLAKDNLGVIFNEDRSSGLEVAGVDASTKGLKLVAADFSSKEGIDAARTAVEGAISSLRAFGSDFSNAYTVVQNREDFTSNLVNVLTEGADKLTLADMNTEAANMLALQTKQQLGVQALSMASQADQSILRLF